MSTKYAIRVLRPCYVNGTLVLADQHVSVSAEVASDLVRGGKAVLVKSSDVELIVAESREALLRFAGQQRAIGQIGPPR